MGWFGRAINYSDTKVGTTFQLEDLFQLGPIEIVIEHGTGGEGASFETAAALLDARGTLKVSRRRRKAGCHRFWFKQVRNTIA
jgi:hypothetical protein